MAEGNFILLLIYLLISLSLYKEFLHICGIKAYSRPYLVSIKLFVFSINVVNI
jgi:hypothetical protein